MAPKPEPAPDGKSYEARDANARWIFGIIAGLFVSIAVAEVVMHWSMSRLRARPEPTDPWSGVRRQSGGTANGASFPKLQVAPPEDLQRFRARETAELTSYGWLNRTAGVVRLPVERAMDLVLERGLPVRTAVGRSRLGPTPLELQQQRTNSTQAETEVPR